MLESNDGVYVITPKLIIRFFMLLENITVFPYNPIYSFFFHPHFPYIRQFVIIY